MARAAGLGEKRRSNNETVGRSVRRLEKNVSKEIVRRKDQARCAAKLLHMATAGTAGRVICVTTALRAYSGNRAILTRPVGILRLQDKKKGERDLGGAAGHGADR